jgi:hypothetical protein
MQLALNLLCFSSLPGCLLPIRFLPREFQQPLPHTLSATGLQNSARVRDTTRADATRVCDTVIDDRRDFTCITRARGLDLQRHLIRDLDKRLSPGALTLSHTSLGR